MADYKVLFVDDEDYIRSMLAAYFKDKFEVMDTADCAAAALEMLGRGKYDLVVSDINMPGMDGPDFLTEVQSRHPDVKRALLTSSNIDEYVTFARSGAVSSIIPKTVPFNFGEIEDIIMGLLTGDIFGLERYLRRGEGAIIEKYCIKSSSEARTVRDAIVAQVEEKFGNSADTKIVLDEILMNAIYHAPTRVGGVEKYTQYTEVSLEPAEYVFVELGCDSEKYGIAVLDKCGALTKDIVLDKLHRQITGEGYMDESGRGLHMCRLFADRLVINIERNKRTEVVIMNYIGGKYRGYKPLYINEV
ncbi:MAG: response regulator [Chitinispirillia bacterium]|nr:response regulator [Chitinispirillia bacterium]MCL2269293.1 response regulator [Chitinispirillia bacterium]